MIASHLGMATSLLVTAAAAYAPGACGYRVIISPQSKAPPCLVNNYSQCRAQETRGHCSLFRQCFYSWASFRAARDRCPLCRCLRWCVVVFHGIELY